MGVPTLSDVLTENFGSQPATHCLEKGVPKRIVLGTYDLDSRRAILVNHRRNAGEGFRTSIHTVKTM